MPDRNDDWIARRAYALWEEEGRPDGRDSDHWHAALREYEAMLEASRVTTESADRRIAMAQARLNDDVTSPLEDGNVSSALPRGKAS